MILLDTNILSELMRERPAARVFDWVNRRPASELGITAVTVAEILYGIGRMPEGKKKRTLLALTEKMFEKEFSRRILPFDAHAAVEYAAIVLAREKMGEPISMADAEIASICRLHGYALATRNTADFRNTGIKLIDPWEEESGKG